MGASVAVLQVRTERRVRPLVASIRGDHAAGRGCFGRGYGSLTCRDLLVRAVVLARVERGRALALLELRGRSVDRRRSAGLLASWLGRMLEAMGRRLMLLLLRFMTALRCRLPRFRATGPGLLDVLRAEVQLICVAGGVLVLGQVALI